MNCYKKSLERLQKQGIPVTDDEWDRLERLKRHRIEARTRNGLLPSPIHERQVIPIIWPLPFPTPGHGTQPVAATTPVSETETTVESSAIPTLPTFPPSKTCATQPATASTSSSATATMSVNTTHPIVARPLYRTRSTERLVGARILQRDISPHQRAKELAQAQRRTDYPKDYVLQFRQRQREERERLRLQEGEDEDFFGDGGCGEGEPFPMEYCSTMTPTEREQALARLRDQDL